MSESTFKLVYSREFERRAKKLVKSNPGLKPKIKKSLILISTDSFNPTLKSHKVKTSNYGLVYSSRVTGNLRILWVRENDEVVIFVITIGGHEGGSKVYR